MAWGPWGLRGFSLTARTKEERKQIQWAVEREEVAAIKFVSKGGDLANPTPGEPPQAPSAEYADASTWNEYSGLYLVCDWGVRGGGRAAGDRCLVPIGLPLPLPHYLALLRSTCTDTLTHT